ncbi:hypothetical protein PIB30_084391 [Stylosanthes scabra]|uniref:Retrotransposon gag domain-containing protein n=1 Tax=Stylosanthes scabra TaxID=79078 RepID=A0ABU6RTB8_9FABA|nr:hypothetical protein [Stylosanthes scabra]
MTVAEYTRKYEDLCRFSRMGQGNLAEFEEWKCIKYEGGLPDVISRHATLIRIWHHRDETSRTMGSLNDDFLRAKIESKTVWSVLNVEDTTGIGHAFSVQTFVIIVEEVGILLEIVRIRGMNTSHQDPN